MHSSPVPFAVCVGALLALAACGAAPVKAGAGCCAQAEVAAAGLPPGADAEAVYAPEPEPRPTPLDHEAEGLAIGGVYEDVFRVLKDDNSCSRFYGGPRVAVRVFNEFARRLRGRSLDGKSVGLVMSGDYTTYRDAVSGASYRIFDEAAVNLNGPFFAGPSPHGTRFLVGRFRAETRPAKALMLLHELGHLIRGKNGWLLPNDGSDIGLSDLNTRTVESRCLRQLLALRG